jgi:glycosyltransferase involved in cell wall biosynthesis
MQFSLVIPFFNESAKLPVVLDAINKIDWPTSDYEILLVDNMSSDNSAEIATANMPSNSRLLVCKSFRSSYAARNVGWREAKGQYVLFIDADCVVDRSILSSYKKAISSEPQHEIGVIAGGILPYSRAELTSVEEYSAERKMLNQDSAVKGWAYRPFAQTANALFPRDVLLQVGGFVDRLTSGGDGELSWRILDLTKRRLIYCQDAKVYHWHRESIKDLYAQFEKYGIGRYQQGATISSFDKGLVGVSKDVFLSLFEKAERDIAARTAGETQKALLWGLYDIVARFGNAVGFLGAKSLALNKPGDKNIFASPTYLYRCSACGKPNLDRVPTLAASATEKEAGWDCMHCNSSLAARLMNSLYTNRRTQATGAPPWRFLKFDAFSNLPRVGHDKNTTVLWLSNPESFGTVLTASRLAAAEKTTLLTTYTYPASEDSVCWTPNTERFSGLGSVGFYHDRYSNSAVVFEIVGMKSS